MSDERRKARNELVPVGVLMAAYQCPVCEYVYNEEEGAPREGFPAGTPWSEVPDDWNCPDCGVRDKVDFEPTED